MTPNVAFPFFTIPETCIDIEPWFIRVNGGESAPAAEYVADWDYATELQLSRSIELDVEEAAKCLKIPVDALQLGLIVETGTGPGRFPRKTLSTEFHEITADSRKIDLTINPQSASLSSFLFLTTTLVIKSEPYEFEKLSPKLVNSKLWSDRFVTRLDGEEPRFPIEVASFERLFGKTPEARAPWYVSWNPGDWSRDFHGAVRLYLNDDLPEFMERIQSGDGFLLQSISVDVVGQILERLVTEADVEDIVANAPVGSLAAQAASWIKLAWPDSSLGSLKHKLESQPGRFRACMWAVAESQEEL